MQECHVTVALIPAAGMGRRMGASINKQYLRLADMPIVARTIALFEQSPRIDRIYLVIPAEEIPYCREHIVEAFGFTKVTAVIAGGAERQHSVMNGLKAMRDQMKDDDIVLIHDGVRPFVTEQMLCESISVAREGDGALVAVPVKDTIKTVRDNRVCGTPPRETLWQAQTPQTFRYGAIMAAHLSAEHDGFIGTDDASLFERSGGNVRIIPGDYRNIKITTPEDLILAEAFLAARSTTDAAGHAAAPAAPDQERTHAEPENSDSIVMMAHDLKNPLTAAIGSIDIIREGCLGAVNEEQIEYLLSAIDSCNDVVAMIDNLQDIKRFETGKIQLTPQPFNVGEFVTKAVSRITRAANFDDIRLTTDPGECDPVITVDRIAFSRALDNLLGNALKFTPGGGAITVSCRCLTADSVHPEDIPDYVSLPAHLLKNRYLVRLSVSDSGTGIPLDELRRSCDSRALLLRKTGRLRGGAGLGFLYSRLVIEAAHGIFWAESDGEEGSSFVMLMPCSLKA